MSGFLTGMYNAVWVLALTANTRIISGHASYAAVGMSQVVLCLLYFYLVRRIAKAPQSAVAWYVAGGVVGGIAGVALTGWTRG